MLAVPGFTDAAYAQKKKKDAPAEAAGPVYSKEFVEAYQPIEAALKDPAADVTALKPQIEALAAMASSPDEKLAVGGMIFNAGITGKDTALQMRGAETMLASGKTKPEDTARFAFVVAQIATSLQQYEKADTYLQQAIDLNYSAPNLTTADVKMNRAELLFAQERYAEGLDYVNTLIAERKAEGQPVNPKWYARGVQIAYNNEIEPQIYDLVQNWVMDVPTENNWRDAVNITRNLNDYDGPVLLDLLRLGQRVGTLKEKNDYIFYIEAADSRRLPMEVKSIIEEAHASGAIPKGSDPWVDEQFNTASGLVAEDRAALPTFERDANAPSAKLRTVLAAGDTFLSYGEYTKAAGFFERALGMPEVDRNLAMTRLGIAQIGAGDIAAAQATFAKVDGTRAPIAKLWSAYAMQTAGGGASTKTATGG